jgi:hypothetical protein
VNFAEVARLNLVNRVLTITITLFVTCVIFFGGRGLLAVRSTKAAEAAAKQDLANWEKLKKEVQAVNERPGLKAPESNEAVVKFQGLLQKEAKSKGVRVEFDTVADPQVYVTRFASDTNAAGWKSMDLTMSMYGSFRNIIEVLSTCKDYPVFFEFGPIDLVRNPPKEDGTSSVRASLSVRVMYRE